MNNPQSQPNGMVANIFACLFATLGILTIGTIFVPLAALTAIFGTINSLLARRAASIGINILAWVLVIIGFFSSPVLMLIVGTTAIVNQTDSFEPEHSSAPRKIKELAQPLETKKTLPKANTTKEQKPKLQIDTGKWTTSSIPSPDGLVTTSYIDTIAIRTHPTITPHPQLIISCTYERLGIAIHWQQNNSQATATTNLNGRIYHWHTPEDPNYLLPSKNTYQLLDDLTLSDQLTVVLNANSTHQTATFDTGNFYSTLLKSDRCLSRLSSINE